MSLRQLAAQLGLSQTTVSRALNGYPEVSPVTRDRVKAAAEEMNYAPDARARSLATGRAYAIGHVIPSTSHHEIVNPVFADFIAGASTVYERAGYDIVLTTVPEGDLAATYRSLARRGRIDGAILQALEPDDARIGILREIGLPFVVHGRSSRETAPYSWYDMDNRGAFRDATAALIGLGHRRIALINGPARLDFAMSRRAGFQAALAEAGITSEPGLIFHGQMTEAYGYAVACDLLDGAEPPTALLTASLLIAWGVRRAAEDRGLTLGRDLSVITHDDGLSYLPNGSPSAPIFTATRAPVGEAGQACAEMVLRLIDAPDAGPLTEVQPSPLVLGPTTGPVPA